jgi:pimeloyl-ACP methyl ester carboxylesterase
METITGTAAGVPFTALPPTGSGQGPAPLIVTWHMLDAPRTDAAFAAALPMAGLPAWRVHLGMPMCGARMVGGRLDAAIELAREDALLAFLAPFTRQAADEFPAALSALRDRLPVDDGPVGVLGASLGGAVALQVLTAGTTPIRAVALVNPAVRIRSVVGLVEGLAGHPYEWTAQAHRTADERTSLPGSQTSRPSRRCCWSAGSGTTRSCARTRPPWSMPYAIGTRSRTRSSWSPCRSSRTRWPRNRAWNRLRSCPRPGRSTRS